MWIADQKMSERPTVPIPEAYANVLIAQRFSKWPEECEDRPTDKALFYNAILSIETQATRRVQGWQPGDEIIEY